MRDDKHWMMSGASSARDLRPGNEHKHKNADILLRTAMHRLHSDEHKVSRGFTAEDLLHLAKLLNRGMRASA